MDNQGSTRTYVGDKLDSSTGQEIFTLDYDKNGNIISGMGYTYSYDWDGKLRTATPGSAMPGAEMSFKYDPIGNRVFKGEKTNLATVRSKYILDTIGDLPVILLELDPDDGDAVKKTHIYAGPQILCSYTNNTPTSKYFYLSDRLGSVRLIVNTDAEVLNSYTYLPFGQTLQSDFAQSGSYENNFKFTGQWHDEAIDQYYLRARQYSPQLMRFISRDPIFGKFEQPLTIQKYIYCMNDPVMFVDPEGLWAFYMTGMFQAQMGVAKGIQRGIVYDGTNWGVITTRADGVGAPGFSGGVGLGLSLEAKNIFDLRGDGTSVGSSYTNGLAIGLDGFEGDNGIGGWQLNVGGGDGLPDGHAMRTYTTVEYIPSGSLLGDTYGSIKGDYKSLYGLMEQTWNETFWNIRSQDEAYGWYLGYGILDNAFRE